MNGNKMSPLGILSLVIFAIALFVMASAVIK